MSSKAKSRSPKRPFVFSNFAMTADGKIAFATDNFVPFSSRRDRDHMMELRATADAVICGARTVEETGTILGTGGDRFRKERLKNGLSEFPLRVIVSGAGTIDPGAKIFQKRFSPIVILTTAKISKTGLKSLSAVADDVEIFGGNEIDFRAAFRWLRARWRVKRLLCEGGGELHEALARADLLNELHLTISPVIFGGKDAPTIADGRGFKHLKDALPFRLASCIRHKSEFFTIWKRAARR